MSYTLDVLKLRDFRILFATRVMATMAMQAQAVIVGWQIYSLTKSPFMLGLTGLAEAIPALACALISGHIVDNSRPYRVFVACLAALALNMVFLFLTAGSVFAMPHDVLVPCMFAGVFFSGLARSFVMPSSFSLQPQIIPRHLIPSAAALLTSGFQAGVISGPAIAGIIYGGYGATVAWVMPLTLMCAGALLSFGISSEHRSFRSQQKREPAVASIKAGWAFIFSTKLLLSIMALDMFAVLFGGAVSMLPAFADQILHLGSEGLGILRAAPAIGAIGMTLWFAVRPMKVVKGNILLLAVAGFGLSIIGFGLANGFWMAMFCLALSGAFDSISMVIRYTLVQWLTPANMRGRVSSVNSMFIISSNEIGAFESGAAAHVFGLIPSIIIGGVGTLLVVAATTLLFPKLRTTSIEAETKQA